MYQAYADVSNPNPPLALSDGSPSKVTILAEFPHPYCSVSQKEPGGLCKLDVAIKPQGNRKVMINATRPIIGLQEANDKGIPAGLPQLSICNSEDLGQGPVFTLQFDLFYEEDFDRRMRCCKDAATEPEWSDFVLIDPAKGFNFSYNINQSFDYVASRARHSIMRPRGHYYVVAGLPGTPDNEGHWYAYEPVHMETVPVELESTARGDFELID